MSAQHAMMIGKISGCGNGACYIGRVDFSGAPYMQTSVTWQSSKGRSNYGSTTKVNQVYSKSQFKAWCRRNGVQFNQQHAEFLAV